jgi:hypothetical protein
MFNKERIKKNAIKIGLDAIAIILCGVASMSIGEFVPVLKGLEVFVAVSSGIWLYVPISNLVKKIKK